jgi:hypothetical protein
MSDRRSPAGMSLAAETGELRDEESRLKARIGYATDQADLPIGRRFANPPHKVLQNQPQVEGFWEM